MKAMKLLSGIVVLAALAAGLGAAWASTPEPNSAVVITRVFNDCPSSVVTVDNSYPSLISIEDAELFCPNGFANLHVWRFSEDGIDPVLFWNDSQFRFAADLVIDGTSNGEAGLQIAPWWSQLVDGRFNVRTTDGEIACFGGRLPFFSFTGAYGLAYVKGTTIHLEMIYTPNGLSETDPATIEYKLVYDGMEYSSGIIPFDEGNPNEPYGTWGCLDEAQAGGHVQVFIQDGDDLTATWSNITYEGTPPVPVEETSWGRVKSTFR